VLPLALVVKLVIVRYTVVLDGGDLVDRQSDSIIYALQIANVLQPSQLPV
jgi:hypothetical protein